MESTAFLRLPFLLRTLFGLLLLLVWMTSLGLLLLEVAFLKFLTATVLFLIRVLVITLLIPLLISLFVSILGLPFGALLSLPALSLLGWFTRLIHFIGIEREGNLIAWIERVVFRFSFRLFRLGRIGRFWGWIFRTRQRVSWPTFWQIFWRPACEQVFQHLPGLSTLAAGFRLGSDFRLQT